MPIEHADRTDQESLRQYRHQLVSATPGVDLSFDDGTLRLANVPLFKDVDGHLRQAVRVRFEPSPGATGCSARIGRDGTWLDEIQLGGNAVQIEFLFVPEVDHPVAHTIEVRKGDSVIATATLDVVPQRKWTIHLIHHSHYDIGYTDPQATVLGWQLAYIDDALEHASATDAWPDEARYRWSIEVNWPLRQWLRTRSRGARDELVRWVRAGRIEVNALPFTMHTEALSYDELARQLDFAQELRDTLGIEITTAMQTDVPGSTIGLSSLLTDAGIEFLAVAHNYAGRSIPHLLDGQELSRPFYWQAPDGDRLMVWYTDTLHGHAYMEAMTIGFGDGFDEVLMSLPEYLNALAQRNYPYPSQTNWTPAPGQELGTQRGGYPHDILHLRVMGAFADNGPTSLLPASIVREWHETYAWPKLRTSTNRAFHDDVKRRIGDRLDTFSGDWTDWWADGIGSGASALGRNRHSQSAIRTAQTLNGLAVALGDAPIATEPDEVRTAYEEMALFDEHTWGAANPWDTSVEHDHSGEHQWLRKAGFAYTAEERVQTLLQGGIERFGRVALGSQAPAGDEALAVFNPNSWSRSDLVRLFVPESAWPGDGAILTEHDTGQPVPYVAEPQKNWQNRPKGMFLHFLARDVPSFGYVRYALAPGQEKTAAGAGAPAEELSTTHFTVELDLAKGVISSLQDVAGNRELIDTTAPFGFGAYIYDRYTTAAGFNHLSSRTGSAQPWMLGSRASGAYGLVTSRASNPVWERLTYRQTVPGADWIETTLTLPLGVPRLHIQHRLHKPATMEKESVYVAFPFAGDNPRLTFEVTGGTVGPDSPHVPGSARHFRAIRHWATVETDGALPVAWATTQAPLIQVGNIHLPYAPFPTSIREPLHAPGTIYSWALNNIWDTNFPPQQGGEMRFDYVVAIGGKDAPALGRDTGATAAQPLVALRARRGQQATTLPDRGSLLEVDDPRVEVTHVAADASGEVVLHLQSHAIDPVRVRVEAPLLPIDRAVATSFIGANPSALEVTAGGVAVDVAPGALTCVRLALTTT